MPQFVEYNGGQEALKTALEEYKKELKYKEKVGSPEYKKRRDDRNA